MLLAFEQLPAPEYSVVGQYSRPELLCDCGRRFVWDTFRWTNDALYIAITPDDARQNAICAVHFCFRLAELSLNGASQKTGRLLKSDILNDGSIGWVKGWKRILQKRNGACWSGSKNSGPGLSVCAMQYMIWFENIVVLAVSIRLEWAVL